MEQIFKRDPENFTTIVLKSVSRIILLFFNCFRRLTPLLRWRAGSMLRASHVAGVSRQDCRALFANERCRASARAMRRWETSSGAPETGLEHCAWSLSAPRLLGAGSTRPQGGLGWWAVTWAMGAVRAGAHEGDAWRGAGYGLVHPRVLTAWEGRLCVGPARGVLPCSRALSRSTGPFASKGVPGLSRRGGNGH